jgi:hypothetical protein
LHFYSSDVDASRISWAASFAPLYILHILLHWTTDILEPDGQCTK